MVAAVLCLPLLMGMRLVHVFRSHDDAIDSIIISSREDLDLLNVKYCLEDS